MVFVGCSRHWVIFFECLVEFLLTRVGDNKKERAIGVWVCVWLSTRSLRGLCGWIDFELLYSLRFQSPIHPVHVSIALHLNLQQLKHSRVFGRLSVGSLPGWQQQTSPLHRYQRYSWSDACTCVPAEPLGRLHFLARGYSNCLIEGTRRERRLCLTELPWPVKMCAQICEDGNSMSRERRWKNMPSPRERSPKRTLMTWSSYSPPNEHLSRVLSENMGGQLHCS